MHQTNVKYKMPTVIALDVSYSMSRSTACLNNGENQTLLQLAIHGIKTFLDYLSHYAKLEFVSLVAFSSLYEVISGFTRDYASIKDKLHQMEEFDKTSIENVLHGINNLVLSEWGHAQPCQVILVTDGCLGHSQILSSNKPSPLPFAFPGKLHIMCVTKSDDLMFAEVKPIYRQLLDSTGSLLGNLYSVDAQQTLDNAGVAAMFKKMADENYHEFKATLKCGHLDTKVLISPAPEPYVEVGEYETNHHTLSTTIEVCGFIPVSDIGSPMAVSRHLLLPAPTVTPSGNNDSKVVNVGDNGVKMDESQSEDDATEEGKVPSLCVILHGALKIENMAALVLVGDNWYGFVYSWADNRKKSNLMLMVLSPGTRSVPWLGDFRCLGNPDQASAEDLPAVFPVKATEKRSYAQSSLTWIKHSGLQSDIQKILRQARKLPDKTANFYKELNRIRRSAISLGLLELLDVLVTIFERECTLLPGTVSPDCALQLTHVANELKKPHNRDISVNVNPLITKFTQRFPAN